MPPTVQLVKLQCTFYDPDVDHFVRLWDQASGIRHMALVYNIARQSRAFRINSLLPFPTPQGAIPLDALHLSSTEMLDYYLLEHSCPFDLSKLKSLSIGWRACIPWREFAPLIWSIEELDVVLNSTTSALAPLLSLSVPLPPCLDPRLESARICRGAVCGAEPPSRKHYHTCHEHSLKCKIESEWQTAHPHLFCGHRWQWCA